MPRAAAIGTALAVVLLGAGLFSSASAQTSSPSPSPTQRPQGNCVVCHGDRGIIEESGDPGLYVRPDALAASVHTSLDCSACHATLSAVLHQDPVRELQIALQSCGRCHQKEWEQWSAGAHGPGGVTAETSREAPGDEPLTARPKPTCITCHGAHEISPATTREFAAATATVCSDCHTERGESYFDRNYHGKETHLGRNDVAVCADCHGAHLILPASDPRSSVNPANVLSTCQQCHKDAPPHFGDIEIHVAGPLPSDPKLRAVTLYMLVILTGTFLFFGLLMILAIRHEWRARRPEAARTHGGEG